MTVPVVLFIDDDETDGLLTFKKLTNLGFAPRFHRGPFGTLAAIRDTRCDVVLLDVNMPSLDGPSLVRVIRHTYNQLPVLLHSNMEKPVLDRIAKHVDADGAVTKNMTADEFGRTIRSVLAEAKERAEFRVRAFG